VTKVVVLVLGVVMFAALAGLLWYLANRFERAEEPDRPDSLWRPAERAEGDGLHILIERVATGAGAEVLETRELGVVPDGDPDRAARLEDVRTLAADRARLLNDQARHR
jgi:hypothetical protein